MFAFLFGGLGIHKFYLGQYKKGILYVLFSWTGLPSLFSFIEMILLLTMSEQDFYIHYNLDVDIRMMDHSQFDTKWSLVILRHKKQLLWFYRLKIDFPKAPYEPKDITRYINEVRPYLIRSQFYKRYLPIAILCLGAIGFLIFKYNYA